MNSIEAYIQFKPGLITDDGEVTDPSTEEFLRDYMMQFHALHYSGLYRASQTGANSCQRGPERRKRHDAIDKDGDRRADQRRRWRLLAHVRAAGVFVHRDCPYFQQRRIGWVG